jgi:hypothetical protein
MNRMRAKRALRFLKIMFSISYCSSIYLLLHLEGGPGPFCGLVQQAGSLRQGIPGCCSQPQYSGPRFSVGSRFCPVFGQFRWFPEFPSFLFYEFTSFFRFQMPRSTCFLVPMVKVPSEQCKCARAIMPSGSPCHLDGSHPQVIFDFVLGRIFTPLFRPTVYQPCSGICALTLARLSVDLTHLAEGTKLD